MKAALQLPPTRDLSPEREQFAADVIAGLSASPKTLPCQYFYDERGSKLFEEICELPEYYLTRAELAIMEHSADAMAERIGPGALLVEYGSGAALKTRYLLDRLVDPAGYVPIDISREHLTDAAARIASAYPHIEVMPVCADYSRDHPIPTGRRAPNKTVVYFPGSTFGNFEPGAAAAFLDHVGREIGPGGGFLIGLDTEKDASILVPAYDDAQGVTGAFNRNLLVRLRDELGADVDPDGFAHRAVYNVPRHRIEMHLVALGPRRIALDGRAFAFSDGETICTEYSHKYSPERFAALAADRGLVVEEVWTDAGALFTVQYLTRA